MTSKSVPDKWEHYIGWLVNRVKELKNDVRKIKKEMNEDDEIIKELSDMVIKVVQRQKEMEKRLDRLESKI